MIVKCLTEKGHDKLAVALARLGVTKDNLITIHPGNGSRFHAFYWADENAKPKPTPKPKAKSETNELIGD